MRPSRIVDEGLRSCCFATAPISQRFNRGRRARLACLPVHEFMEFEVSEPAKVCRLGKSETVVGGPTPKRHRRYRVSLPNEPSREISIGSGRGAPVLHLHVEPRDSFMTYRDIRLGRFVTKQRGCNKVALLHSSAKKAQLSPERCFATVSALGALTGGFASEQDFSRFLWIIVDVLLALPRRSGRFSQRMVASFFASSCQKIALALLGDLAPDIFIRLCFSLLEEGK